MSRPTLIERAYEMARSGDHASTPSIQKALRQEDYLDAEGHLSGKALRLELNALCREAQGRPPLPLPGGRRPKDVPAS